MPRCFIKTLFSNKMAPASWYPNNRLTIFIAQFTACCAVALLYAVGFSISQTKTDDQRSSSHKVRTTRPDVQLLPYQTDTKSQQMLKRLLETGQMQKLVNVLHSDAATVSQYYPSDLSLRHHKFWTLNGEPLETDSVLEQVLYKYSNYSRPIPNVVHFYFFSVSGGIPKLRFPNYLSVLAALWKSGADVILVWCNAQPAGRYWDLVVHNATAHGLLHRIVLASRPVVRRIFNRTVAVIHHRVDLMKLQTAIIMGGMFMDSDSVVVRSLQPLRRHSCVIGRETPYGLSIGTLIAAPSSAFVLLWYMLYQTFHDHEWNVHSVRLPHEIWLRFPELCHVENNTMVRPNWHAAELEMLYQTFDALPPSRRWNWDANYMVHQWRSSNIGVNESSVRTLNSMYGQVARYILYGTRLLF